MDSASSNPFKSSDMWNQPQNTKTSFQSVNPSQASPYSPVAYTQPTSTQVYVPVPVPMVGNSPSDENMRNQFNANFTTFTSQGVTSPTNGYPKSQLLMQNGGFKSSDMWNQSQNTKTSFQSVNPSQASPYSPVAYTQPTSTQVYVPVPVPMVGNSRSDENMRNQFNANFTTFTSQGVTSPTNGYPKSQLLMQNGGFKSSDMWNQPQNTKTSFQSVNPSQASPYSPVSYTQPTSTQVYALFPVPMVGNSPSDENMRNQFNANFTTFTSQGVTSPTNGYPKSQLLMQNGGFKSSDMWNQPQNTKTSFQSVNPSQASPYSPVAYTQPTSTQVYVPVPVPMVGNSPSDENMRNQFNANFTTFTSQGVTSPTNGYPKSQLLMQNGGFKSSDMWNQPQNTKTSFQSVNLSQASPYSPVAYTQPTSTQVYVPVPVPMVGNSPSDENMRNQFNANFTTFTSQGVTSPTNGYPTSQLLMQNGGFTSPIPNTAMWGFQSNVPQWSSSLLGQSGLLSNDNKAVETAQHADWIQNPFMVRFSNLRTKPPKDIENNEELLKRERRSQRRFKMKMYFKKNKNVVKDEIPYLQSQPLSENIKSIYNQLNEDQNRKSNNYLQKKKKS